MNENYAHNKKRFILQTKAVFRGIFRYWYFCFVIIQWFCWVL